MPGPTIFNQSQSVFDFNVADPSGILPLQLEQTNAPAPISVVSGTNLIIPDKPTTDQLINFPEEVYDLRETSHLVRLMRALLGDSGTGQLRKRVLLTRLETALNGANFFDVDRFYGAIFGALRAPTEELTINPMNDVATPDEWDQILAADANFRERIKMLAKAIMMGATIPGLRAAAMAVVAAPVDIYETWAILDAYGPSGYSNTYNSWATEESLHPTWQSFSTPVQLNWSKVEGRANIGRLDVATRGEVVVRPHKNYASLPPHTKDIDQSALSRVLQRLKPAATIVTISTDADQIHIPVPIASIHSDSNYWEVVRKVSPNPNLSNLLELYPLSNQQIEDGVDPTSNRILPIPPFCQGHGVGWTMNGSIRNIRGYSRSYIDVATGNIPSNWMISSVPDEQTVLFNDGQSVTYSAVKGVMPASRATAALAASDGSLMAHPYSGDRVQVAPHA